MPQLHGLEQCWSSVVFFSWRASCCVFVVVLILAFEPLVSVIHTHSSNKFQLKGKTEQVCLCLKFPPFLIRQRSGEKG